MAKQLINRGSAANDGTGDNLRNAGLKINDNFNEIYTAVGDGTTLTGYIRFSDGTTNVDRNLGQDIQFIGGTGINSSISGNQITLAVDGTIVTTTSTNALSNKTIDLTDNTITGTLAEFNTAVSDAILASTAGSETLTNKTINFADNTITTTTANFNTALTDGDIATLAGSETLTNKTLTSPVINSPTGDVATKTGVQTLTNKTLTSPTINGGTLSGINLFTVADTSSTVSTITSGDVLKLIGGSGITTTVSGDEVTVTASGLTNASLSGSAGITNANLANDSVTIGYTAVALGSSATTVNGLSITGNATLQCSGNASAIGFNHANFASFPTASTYPGSPAIDEATTKLYMASGSGWIELLSENSAVENLSNVNTTGIADGQGLVWSSSNTRFEAGSVGGAPARYEDATARLAVTASGSSAYRFTSHYGNTNNPALYTRQGQTIAFDLSGLSGSHPFALQTSSGAYNSANRISTGLVHVDNGTVTTGLNAQGKTSGTLFWEVPHDQDTVYYVCTAHSAMAGTVVVNKKGQGLEASSIWLLTSNLSLTGDSSFADITANLSESSLTGYGRLGDAMTESSGVFTFPSTGIWEVEAVYNFSGSDGYGRGEIKATTNNSTYSTVAQSQEETDNDEYANISLMAQIDVTDTSQVKVKFTQGGTATSLAGDSGFMRTGFKFKRLGDT